MQYKTCNKCKRALPKTIKTFSRKDGVYSNLCRKCAGESRTYKTRGKAKGNTAKEERNITHWNGDDSGIFC